jgi:hypothetical protein
VSRITRKKPEGQYPKGVVVHPRLPAYPRKDGYGLRVWCCWCDAWHYHGEGFGHRADHCITNSPYVETGYVLTDPATIERKA